MTFSATVASAGEDPANNTNNTARDTTIVSPAADLYSEPRTPQPSNRAAKTVLYRWGLDRHHHPDRRSDGHEVPPDRVGPRWLENVRLRDLRRQRQRRWVQGDDLHHHPVLRSSR